MTLMGVYFMMGSQVTHEDEPGSLTSAAVASAEKSCANLCEKLAPLDSYENICLQHTTIILIVNYIGVGTSRVAYYFFFFFPPRNAPSQIT